MTDDNIINLFYERSESAITETKNSYESLCKAIINNIVSNEQDVDECLNDTYLRLWEYYTTSETEFTKSIYCTNSKIYCY